MTQTIVRMNPPTLPNAGEMGYSQIAIVEPGRTDLTPERLDQLFPPLLEMFNGAKPCITGVGVAALAAPDLQVELELTVRLPDVHRQS